MNVKEILDFEEKACAGDVTENEIDEFLNKMGEYLNNKSTQGMGIILSKMEEDRFVRLVREVKRALMVSMLQNNSGELLTLADMAGDLDPLIHTTFLSVLAILADEEVI